MITVRKLQSLPDTTRLRKTARLLESWVRSHELPSASYLRALMGMVQADETLPALVRARAAALSSAMKSTNNEGEEPVHPMDAVRAVDTVRHLLLQHLGEEPAEWDLIPTGAGAANPNATTAGDSAPQHRESAGAAGGRGLERVALYLESVRSPFNLGSILRTAAAFGVRTVGVSDDCPDVGHRRVRRSAMGADGCVRVVRGTVEALRRDYPGPLIALELGGTPVGSFGFPEAGILMLGSEELGLSRSLLERADARLSVPMPGLKASLNVGVACGIALAFWAAATG